MMGRGGRGSWGRGKETKYGEKRWGNHNIKVEEVGEDHDGTKEEALEEAGDEGCSVG